MDLDKVVAELGNPKIKNKSERMLDAMQKYAKLKNEELKEADRKAALLRDGVEEVPCSWCGKVCIPSFRGGGLAACELCMNKALMGALGEPQATEPLPEPPKAIKKPKKKKDAKPAWAEKDPDEINEPAVTKAV